MAIPIGQSGTLISAAMQSAGYYYQSWIIDNFVGHNSGLHTLLFMFGAVTIVFSFALYGQARNVMWLLIGPALFSALLGSRTETTGAEWKFGGEARDQAAVRAEYEQMTGRTAYVPRVSTFFATFERMVSQGVQDITKTLLAGKDDADLNLLFRAKVLSMLMHREVSDPGLQELVQLSLLGECSELVTAGQGMSDERQAPDTRCAYAKRFSELSQTTHLALTQGALNYLAAFKVDSPTLFNSQVALDLPGELSKFQTKLTAAGGSCDLSAAGSASTLPGADAASTAATSLASSQASVPTTAVRSASEVDAAAAGQSSRENAIAQAREELAQGSYSCQQIWNWVYGALHFEGERAKTLAAREAEEQGRDPEEFLTELSGFTGSFTSASLTEGIARRLFRNSAMQSSTSALIRRYADQGASIERIGLQPGGTASEMYFEEAAMNEEREYSAKVSLLATASSLPYYQGLFLYFLSMSFPFFALLLLLPGQLDGFFLWIRLWLWLKSWDIGFAVAALIDDVLYSIFFTSISSPAQAERQVLDKSFAIAVGHLKDVDPSFSFGTYYNIIAMVLSSVPVISSYLILGGTSGGAKLIQQGVSRISRAIGASYSNAQNQLYEDQLRSGALETRIANEQGYIATDSTTGGIGGAHTPTASYNRTQMYRSSPTFGLKTNKLLEDSYYANVASGFINGTLSTDIKKQGFSFGTTAAATMGKTLSSAGAEVMMGLAEQRMGIYSQWGSQDMEREKGLDLSLEYTRRGAMAVADNPDASALEAEFAGQVGRLRTLVDNAADTAKNLGENWSGLSKPITGGSKAVSSTVAGVLAAGAFSYMSRQQRSTPQLPSLTVGGDLQKPIKAYVEDGFNAPRAHQTKTGVVHARHRGADLFLEEGATPEVRPISSGKVLYAGPKGTFGNLVIVQHANGTVSLYAHLKDKSINVKAGDDVGAGTVIGEVGDTGNARGEPHLHLEVLARADDGSLHNIDPVSYLKDGSMTNHRAANSAMAREIEKALKPADATRK